MQRDIIPIRLSAINGSKSLSVYLNNLLPIHDKIKQKFFRLKDLIFINQLLLTKNINLSVIIIKYVMIRSFLYQLVVCKIPLFARALGLKAARPSARATIGYIVYKSIINAAYQGEVRASA